MRAQIQGQVFIYILSLVIIAGVLLFGYNAIQDFQQKSEQVTLVKLQTDLQNAVDTISSDFGSVKKLSLSMGEFRELCFVESYAQPDLADFAGADPLIRDSVQSQAQKNIFLVKDSIEHSFFSANIAVEPDYLCFSKRSNTVHLRLEGRGDHTLISAWPITP